VESKPDNHKPIPKDRKGGKKENFQAKSFSDNFQAIPHRQHFNPFWHGDFKARRRGGCLEGFKLIIKAEYGMAKITFRN